MVPRFQPGPALAAGLLSPPASPPANHCATLQRQPASPPACKPAHCPAGLVNQLPSQLFAEVKRLVGGDPTCSVPIAESGVVQVAC